MYQRNKLLIALAAPAPAGARANTCLPRPPHSSDCLDGSRVSALARMIAVEPSVGTPSSPSTGATPCTNTALMAALDRARTERPPSLGSRSAAARGGHEHAPQAPHDRTATTMLILPRATSVRRVALMTTLTICSTSSRSGTCSGSRGSEGDAAAGGPTFLVWGGGGGCCFSCCTKF